MTALLLTGTAALFGLLIGSFLNVVAYRVPNGLSVVAPASACPGCSTPIAGRDNVPVLSWLLLRGRCRHCAMRISPRYPAVEAGTAIAFALAALPFVARPLPLADPTATVAAIVELIAYLYLAAVSVVLAVIDLDVRRLPDRIVLPGYAVGAVLLAAVAVLRGESASFGVAAAASGAAALLFAVIWFAVPGGMGLGDVKLAGVLGLFLGHLGVAQAVIGIAGGFVVGGVVGIALMALGRSGRKSAIPFGPFMVAGAWLGIFFGQPLAAAYLRLTGLA